MSDLETAALARAISAVVAAEGSANSIIHGAGVRQPVVSLALNRRLVIRTPPVERLFEYLKVGVVAESDEYADAVHEDGGRQRRRHLLGLLDGLSDGTRDADERLAVVLDALRSFARREQG